MLCFTGGVPAALGPFPKSGRGFDGTLGTHGEEPLNLDLFVQRAYCIVSNTENGKYQSLGDDDVH